MRRLRRVAPLSALIFLAVGAQAHAVVQVSQSGWAWGNPQPQGNTIRAIQFNQGRGYAVGDAGTALRTDDAGATWIGLPTGTTANFGRLQVVTPDVVIALGGDGCVVRRSDDGGRTFRKVFVLAELNCPDRVEAAHFVSPEVGYLILRDGNVLRTTDRGETFSRQTAIPGTPASTGGGNAAPTDVAFTSNDAGIVFMRDSNTAYRTTDAGVSWQPEGDVAAGAVRRVRFVSPEVAYAVGPNTLLRSTDAGQTWERRPAGEGANVTSIDCATPDLCLMTTGEGDRLLRTEDGGATATSITAATQALFAAGFASPTRAVAAGAGGTTVVSDDAGRNYQPVGGDIGGSYPFGLRPGPAADTAFALGSRGQLARTTDGGATWRSLNVATSADLRDASFTGGDVGYVLDARGGLFKTANAGTSWQPLDPGTQTAPRAVMTSGSDVVLLAGPQSIRRQEGNGRFEAVRGKALRQRGVIDRFDRAGTAITAYGTTRAVMSTNAGRTWRKVRLPKLRRKVSARITDLDFVTASRGFVLDLAGRLWTTGNGGRSWKELPGLGTGSVLSLAFSTPTSGFVTLSGFAAGPGAAYTLRTGDGGKTWRPQRISTGEFPATEGVVATSATRAFALTTTPSAGQNVFRSLFTTNTGGDFGAPSSLTIGTGDRTLTRRQLRRANGRITVSGTLSGAQGGEPIVVSARDRRGRWSQQVVAAGANNGSWTATFPVRGTAQFVAQWPGDSARQGDGTTALRVRVR